jgi:hypothetical protein
MGEHKFDCETYGGVVYECVAHEFACMFEEKLLLLGVFKSIITIGQLELEVLHANRRKWMSVINLVFLTRQTIGQVL